MTVEALRSAPPPAEDGTLALSNLGWMIVGLQLRENCVAAALAEWSDEITFDPTLKRIQEEIFTVHREGHRPSPPMIAARLAAEELPGIPDVGETLRMWSLAAPAVLSDEEAGQRIRGAFQAWRVGAANISRNHRRQQADELLRARGVDAFDDVAALLSESGEFASQIQATPFQWTAPEDIPHREWIFGRHAVAAYVSVTGSAGGIGKSSLIASELLSVATGKNILRDAPVRGGRCWYIGLEDPIDEHRRRFTAAALLHKLAPEQFDGRLFLDDASQDFVVARETREGISIAEPVVAGITEQIRRNQISLLVVDPFVACHAVAENDNGAINAVAEVWRRIARETGCAVELIHHSRKSNGQEVTADDMRGASALAWAARSVRTLSGMTKEEAERYGITEPWRYFRVAFGKSNLAPRDGEGVWRELVGIDLRNSGDGPSDHVAAVAAWVLPDASSIATVEQFEAIKAAIAGGSWRADFRSKDWVGNAIAQVMELDLRETSVRKSIASAVKAWIGQGELCIRERKNPNARKPFDYVEVAS